MNLKKLETFYWAAKLGSFSAAAEHLNATQSAVSMRIQELEREFDLVLFDRSQRAARVTPIGRELMQYAEQLLRISAEMRERIASTESMPGTLRLGVAEVVSITWLPRLVKEVHTCYPKVRLELEEALTRDLVEKLGNGALDLILAPGDVPGHSFNSVPLGTVEFAWMASPALGLPDGPIAAKDLQHWPVIALSQESFHHASIEDWFYAGDARCWQIDTCKSMGVAASLAASGLGVTLLPVKCFVDLLDTGQLVRVDAVPAFPPIKFTATSARNMFGNLVQRIARIAQQVSTFDDVPAGDAGSHQTESAVVM
jgi:DNA-binding transcriptional LysR family regulator